MPAPLSQTSASDGGLPSVSSLTAELSKSLEQVREFAHAQRARVSRASEDHVRAVDGFTEQVANAREMENSAADQSVLDSEAVQHIRTTLEQMRIELAELKNKEDQFPALEDEHNAKLQTMRQELSRQQAELHQSMTRDQQTLDDLTMAMDRYHKFGLTFKRLGKNIIGFAFKYLDPSEPEKAFDFVLHVDDTDAYQVMECNPPLARVDGVVERLNRTNDFGAFVVEMRRQFQANVLQHQQH